MRCVEKKWTRSICVRDACRHAFDPYSDGEKYGVLRRLVATKDCDGVLADLKETELRGMGGAGFPTSMKWDLVRKQTEAVKNLRCGCKL